MQLSAKTSEYLVGVTREIHWKRARAPIAQELRCHLEDQAEALLDEGLPPDCAEARAIAEMGDAVEIGTALNRAYRPRHNFLALLCAAALFGIGFFGRSLALELTSELGVFRAAPLGLFLSVLLCGGVFLFFSLLDYTRLRSVAPLLYGGYLTALALVLLFGTNINGRIAMGIYFAPLFPIIFSGLIARFRGRGLLGVLLCGGTVLPVLWMLLLVPYLVGALLCGVVCLLLLTGAICRGWFGCRGQQKKAALALCWAPALGLPLLLLWGAGDTLPYLLSRLQLMLHPEIDPYGRGWLVLALRGALDSAVFFGQASTDPALLPLMTSDYLLTFLICRFGWVMLWVVLGLLLCLLFIGLRTAMRQKNALGRMVSLSVVLAFALESVFFVLANLGISSFSSVFFPFFGGYRALLLHAALFGLLMSVLRSGDLFCDLPLAFSAASPRRLFELTDDGALIIRFRG